MINEMVPLIWIADFKERKRNNCFIELLSELQNYLPILYYSELILTSPSLIYGCRNKGFNMNLKRVLRMRKIIPTNINIIIEYSFIFPI